MTLIKPREETRDVHLDPRTSPSASATSRARRRLARGRQTGSLSALLGPSGSGKSTLLRIIAGLEPPDAGAVTIADEDVTGVAPQDRGIGFVFQHYAAFKHMTVFENVAFGLKIRKRPKDEIERARATSCSSSSSSRAWRTATRRSSPAGSGSGWASPGRSRSSRRCCSSTSRSAPSTRACARSCAIWLRRLHDETHTTTVIVTHDQEEAMEVAETVAVMNHGQIEQVAGPVELYEHPANEFVMGFVGAGQPARRLLGAPARPGALARRRTGRRARRWSSASSISGSRCGSSSSATTASALARSSRVTRRTALELDVGQIVYVRPTRQTTFAA